MPLPLERQCELAGLPLPLAEYRFHSTRRWRADFCWPEARLMVEVDGGVFTGGRHTRGSGWLRDQEKLNSAAVLGYHVLHVTPRQVADGTALTWIDSFFRERKSA